VFLFIGVVEASAQKAPPAKPSERFDGCVLEPDEWTDGDSFRVRLPDGRLETFRLYFVDTTESRSRGNRSDEQAAYFGLTREQAVKLGQTAKAFTAAALQRPFTNSDPLASSLWIAALLCVRVHRRRE
jgi:endonuclease YncB( thermonuclease family)